MEHFEYGEGTGHNMKSYNYFNSTLLKFALSILLLLPALSGADIYKWVDDNGKVHFGDNQKKNISDVEEVIIKDKYTVTVAKELSPIIHEGDQKTRTVVLNEIALDLPDSDERNVLIGRIVCNQPVDLYWTKGFASLKKEFLGQHFVNAIEKHGYLARVGDVIREEGELELSGKIKKVFLNSCTKIKSRKLTQDSTYMKIEWTLYDPLIDKEVLTFVTQGSHHGIKEKPVVDGRSVSVSAAFKMAVTNMLANKEFVSELNKNVDIQFAKDETEKLNLKLDFSSDLDSFEESAQDLKDRTVIVKTKEGHGSGVFIAEDGYILTNAHVVRDEETFNIISGSGNFSATLVKKNSARDVALLKIEKKSSAPTPVSIGKKTMHAGEELYVIGTPLDMKFSHTITRGIVSAKRTIRGMEYLQTDAAVNFGNSGGPVFNKRGELVAITVSSVMTREGASLNINYLIPIEDALNRLNIGGKYSTLNILDSFIPDLDIPYEDRSIKDRIVITIYEWLNKPVIHL